MPKVAVLKYPGTNCEEETIYALRNISKLDVNLVWHESFSGDLWDAIVLPGGFSYGDYGRAGLLASWSKASRELMKASTNGIPILGICNGFQILTEIGLLPGNLLINNNARFIARWVRVRVHKPKGPWLFLYEDEEEVSMPIAHAEGRYFCLDESKLDGLSWLEYVNNPNGSMRSIAGVASRDGQILGIMPHPERASFPWQAPEHFDPGGRRVFESIGIALRRGW